MRRTVPDLTCKRGSVGQSEGLSIPRSSVRFRQKPDNSNSHELELHRPSNKGTKLLLKVIKAIVISKQKTYESAYNKLLLQAHCSQVSQCAHASVTTAPTPWWVLAKTHHGVGDGGRERVSWMEPNFNVSECAY